MIDEKTEIAEFGVEYFEGASKYEIIINHNKLMDMYFCRVTKDDKNYGVVARYQTREQAIAWMRLMLGDYPDCHHGVA